jgi:hypothetical protein
VTSPSPGAAGTHRRQRLLRDRELLAAHEPQLRFEMGADGETAEAIGPLSIELPDGSPEAIEVRIEFRSDYPRRPPRAYDTYGRWTPELDRHIEGGGRFCLFLTGANEPDLKPEGALLDYIADVKAFLRQQLILDSQRRHNPHARFPRARMAARDSRRLRDLCRRKPRQGEHGSSGTAMGSGQAS